MPYPYVPSPRSRFITVQLEDISTAGRKFVAPGFRGKIRRAHAAISGAIADSDAVLTLRINGEAVGGGVITLAHTDSAAGDIGACVPIGSNSFNDTDAIEIETNGASTNTVECVITLEVEPA